MDPRTSLVRYLAGLFDGEHRAPGAIATDRPRAPWDVLPPPPQYAGRAGALPLPPPNNGAAVTLPPHMRSRRDEVHGWRQNQAGGWDLAPVGPPPVMRARPGDSSPAGHADFASWENAPPLSRPRSRIAPDQAMQDFAGPDYQNPSGGPVSPATFYPGKGQADLPTPEDDYDDNAAWNAALSRGRYFSGTYRAIDRTAQGPGRWRNAVPADRGYAPRPGPKQLMSSAEVAQKMQDQLRNTNQPTSQQIDPATGWPINPVTGLPEAPLEFERERQEEEARRIEEQRRRDQESQWGVNGRGLTFRRRF